MNKTIISVILIVFLFLGVNFIYPESVLAVIRQQQESPGVLLYQSRHSLRDNTGQSWQVVLFKRVQNHQVQQINLRLVGFPDQVVFRHPQTLKIIDGQGHIWQANDHFAQKYPAPNVGEYNFQNILPQLNNNQSVQLILPLDNERSRSLILPYPVLLEWQLLAE